MRDPEERKKFWTVVGVFAAGALAVLLVPVVFHIIWEGRLIDHGKTAFSGPAL